MMMGVAAAGAWLLVSGCVYSDVRVPMSGEFRNTRTVTRSGEATTRSVAWLVAWGDAGLQKAAENGGLDAFVAEVTRQSLERRRSRMAQKRTCILS